MRQFIEISGSCADKMKVTIRQVYEAGGKLIVFAHLARRTVNNTNVDDNADEMIFRDQVVVETDAKPQEKLPVVYVLVDVDPEDVGQSPDQYAALYQLRGVNRSGDFELCYLGKKYPLSALAKCRYQENPDYVASFRIGNKPQFTSCEEVEIRINRERLRNILNIYSTCQDGVYKVVVEAITSEKKFPVHPRDLFPRAIFAGDDFNRIYKPVIDEPIYFQAYCNRELRQFQTCAVSLDVPYDDFTTVADLIVYLENAWDSVFFKSRKYDLVQISSASVLSCYPDAWFVCARMSAADKRKYRQLVNNPIVLDDFLLRTRRFDFRQSIRTMISNDVQSLKNMPLYELLQQIFVLYADDLQLRRLLHLPCLILGEQSDLDLHPLLSDEVPIKTKLKLIDELEAYLNTIHNRVTRFLFRYLLNRFNRGYSKYYYCQEYASRNQVDEVQLTLEFLKLAVYDLRDDGRICIHLTDHPIFLRQFAGDVEAAKKFFESFAWYVGIDFDKDSDFQSCVIVTPTSSRYLKSYGLHLDGRFWDDAVERKKSLVIYPAADYRMFGVGEKKEAGSVAKVQQFGF